MKDFIIRLFDRLRRQIEMLWGKKEEPMQLPAFQGPTAESEIKEGDDIWEVYNNGQPTI